MAQFRVLPLAGFLFVMSEQDYWFRVSADLMRSTDIDPEARYVWLALCAFRNQDTGEAFPSFHSLSMITGYGVKKIRAAVKKLQALGVISKTERLRQGRLMKSYKFKLSGAESSQVLTKQQLRQGCHLDALKGSVETDALKVAQNKIHITRPSLTKTKDNTGSANAEQDSFEGIKAKAEAVIEAEGLRIPDPETVIETLIADRNSGKISSAAIAGRLRKVSESAGW